MSWSTPVPSMLAPMIESSRTSPRRTSPALATYPHSLSAGGVRCFAILLATDQVVVSSILLPQVQRKRIGPFHLPTAMFLDQAISLRGLVRRELPKRSEFTKKSSIMTSVLPRFQTGEPTKAVPERERESAVDPSVSVAMNCQVRMPGQHLALALSKESAEASPSWRMPTVTLSTSIYRSEGKLWRLQVL